MFKYNATVMKSFQKRICLAITTIAVGMVLPTLGLQAQVLNIPKQPAVESKPIELEGIVVERKKYSFVVNSGDQQYQVKIPNSGTLALRLRKPSFDLNKKAVSVEPIKENKSDPSVLKRVSYPLPDKLFIQARFDHKNQKQRILNAKVKRLNKYEIGPVAYPVSKNPLIIGGEIRSSDEGNALALVIDDQTNQTILGHQQARLVGLNITYLVPFETRVAIKGVLSDGKVIANSIEAWPIVAAKKLADR